MGEDAISCADCRVLLIERFAAAGRCYPPARRVTDPYRFLRTAFFMVIVVDPAGEKHQYQGGRYIEVIDGHLLIRDRAQGETIGIFAPGKWHSAHVDAVPARNGGVVGGGIRNRLGQST
jgi:hypothetical protein